MVTPRADRLATIQPFRVMEVFARAQALGTMGLRF